MFRRCFYLVAVLLWAFDSQADNGEIARAAPLDGIVVDGDLTDWPAGLPRHPVRMNGESEAVERTDSFAASFRAGYDTAANAVYIALEVIDDVHVVSDAAAPDDWQSFDSVIAYVDLNHTVTGSGPALYLVIGDQQAMLSDESSWDADAAAASWETAEAAVARRGTTTVYEWRFTSPRKLLANSVLGIDFLVADHDAPGEDGPATLFSWGPGFGKSQAGGRLGDLLLVDADSSSGLLTGRIELADTDAETQASRLRVRARSTENPALWLQTLADETGAFAIDLPPGRYELTSVDRLTRVEEEARVVAPAAPVSVTVEQSAETAAPTLRLTPVPLPVELPETGALFGFQPDDRDAFDQVVVSLMEHFQVPGASIALVKDGALVHHSTYGSQNAYSGEPVENDTLFEAASVTKAVFAFAVNRMAERGQIDLDRPLHTYLPFEEIAHDKRYEKITARHVLSHQTGFPNWRWINPDGKIDIKFYPGIQYGYSGEGFEYLGRVVAHISREPLETVVRREALAVLDFEKNTFFADGPEVHEQASRGHWAGMAGPHGFPDEIGVAHSMYTEARTFSNFMLGLLAEKGLSADGYEKMLEPQVATPLEPGDEPQWPGRFGLGFHMMKSPFGLAYGHGGNNGDFTCQFELYPDHQMGFVVFTNADTGWLLVNALREYLVTGRSGVEEGED
ncbi:MAG: serine hydrolase [Pseudomonadota bacterium]